MTKGSGTRSGLLWEVERLLNECEELPQVLLMENVPQVHGKKNMDDFQKWITFLESKGYSNFWQDLNARNYGVAQNRNRCFMVSILGNYTYKFPEPILLDKTMKDYLEDAVEDRYYITSEKAKKLIDTLILNGKIPNRTEQNRTGNVSTSQLTSQESLKEQTALRQDTTMESQTCKQTEAVLSKQLTCHMNYNRIDKFTDVANTLCARDYKGPGTGFDTVNGVIEWMKCEEEVTGCRKSKS